MKKNLLLPALALTVISGGFSLPASAQKTLEAPPIKYPVNTIQFSISTSEYFTNDRVSIRFEAKEKANTPERVAKKINAKMSTATQLLAPHTQIQREVGVYQVNALYNANKQVIGWEASQTLTLNLQKVPGLVQIVAKVEPFLHYQGMAFGVSNAQRQTFLDTLTRKAIEAYQEKANLIAQGFHASEYHIVQTHINTPTFPKRYQSHVQMFADALNNKTPISALGNTQLSVRINGTLIIKNK